MTVVSFGPWRADVPADGRVTLIDRRGTVVRLRYVRDGQGRCGLKGVQIEAGGEDSISGRCWRRIPFTDIERHLEGRQQPAECPPVTAPDGRITEGFLKSVASAYLWLTSAGLRPAPGIAEMAGVPVRTVHRWVSDARKRGILPPARPGRAG